MEFSLLYDKSFDYNMIEYTSSTFWDFAYQTIDECKKIPGTTDFTQYRRRMGSLLESNR